jgi:hypothetical protein
MLIVGIKLPYYITYEASQQETMMIVVIVVVVVIIIKVKVQLSLSQAVKAHRVVRRRGSHIF